MPSCSYKNALTTGHEMYKPTTIKTASSDTFVGNKPVARVGDSINVHCKVVEDYDCHDGVVIKGSSTCFVNNKQVARIGDSISCGDAIAQGEAKVQIGG